MKGFYTNGQKIAFLILRFELGINCSEIAQRLNIPRGTLWRWENYGIRFTPPSSPKASLEEVEKLVDLEPFVKNPIA